MTQQGEAKQAPWQGRLASKGLGARYLQAAGGAVGGPHVHDGLRRVVVVGDGAAAGVQRVEHGGCHLDEALAVRQQCPRVPGQEEGAVRRVPAAAHAPEKPSLLHNIAHVLLSEPA